MMTSKVPAHQKSTFGVGKWSPKPHSMFPPAWDLKVIIAGTLEHIFLELLQLKSSLKYFRKYSSELLQLNIRQHGPITHAYSMTCCRTSFSMQLVPDPKVYFPGTSTSEGPQRTRPAPQGRMFHPFALLHPRHLHHQHQHPRIHKLLKLPQLNLSDAITHAHSTTFPHGLAVIRSILF